MPRICSISFRWILWNLFKAARHRLPQTFNISNFDLEELIVWNKLYARFMKFQSFYVNWNRKVWGIVIRFFQSLLDLKANNSNLIYFTWGCINSLFRNKSWEINDIPPNHRFSSVQRWIHNVLGSCSSWLLRVSDLPHFLQGNIFLTFFKVILFLQVV